MTEQELDAYLNSLSDEELQAFLNEAGMDPTQPTQMGTQAPTEAPSTLEDYLQGGEAFVEGFGETATGGYLPQLQAGVQQALPDPNADVDAQLAAQGFNIQQPEDSYVAARDRFIGRGEQLQEESPAASMLGNLAGGASTAIAGGGLLKGGQAAAKGVQAMAKAPSLLAAIGRGAGTGAAMGAAYNPGDEEGVVDPMQLGERAKGAAVGGLAGGALGAAGNAINRLGNRYQNVQKIKNSEQLQDNVRKEIAQATEGVQKNYIDPRMKEMRSLMKGKMVDVDPDSLRGINPKMDKLADALANRRPMVRGAGSLGEEVTQQATSGAVPVKARLANRIRQTLDKEARYAQQAPFAEGTKVAASREGIKNAADSIRGKVQGLDPRLAELFDETKKGIRKLQRVQKSAADNPLTAIKGAPGTDKGARIDWMDKYGKADLEGTAEAIQKAQGDLLSPESLLRPLEAPKEAYKIGKRAMQGAGRLGQKADAATRNSTGKITLLQALEAMRGSDE